MQQRIGDAESSNHAAEFFDAGTFADKFAQKVEKARQAGIDLPCPDADLSPLPRSFWIVSLPPTD